MGRLFIDGIGAQVYVSGMIKPAYLFQKLAMPAALTFTLSACGIFNRQAEPVAPVVPLPPAPVIEVRPEPIVPTPIPQAGLALYDGACSQKDAGDSANKQLCFSVRIGQLTPNKKSFLKGPVAGYFGRFVLPNCVGNKDQDDLACQEDHRIVREQLVSVIQDWGKAYRSVQTSIPKSKTTPIAVGYFIEVSEPAVKIVQNLPGSNKKPAIMPSPNK